MNPLSMRHIAPAFRTYAGPRSLGGLAKELERSGAQRVVLVCGASMVRHASALSLVEDAIGGRLVHRFEDAQEHSPLPSVQAAAQQLTALSADAVVAVGGGSAVVTARAATILAGEQADVRELCTRRAAGELYSPILRAPKIAQWIVPSTPTTAYAKVGAAVRDPDTGERLALFDPKARAAGVFLSPEIAATAPNGLVRSSALNALAMCVDGLQSETDDPLAIAQLRQGLSMLRTWLPRLEEPVSGEVGVRLMIAALLAGEGSNYVGSGLAQPISHALGPHSAVGNGVIEAMMLPHVMKFNKGHADSGLQAVAEALGASMASEPDAAIRSVETLLEATGVPIGLRNTGLDRAALEEAPEHILDDWASKTVPRIADGHELRQILQDAW